RSQEDAAAQVSLGRTMRTQHGVVYPFEFFGVFLPFIRGLEIFKRIHYRACSGVDRNLRPN
ncbi:MAG: hypothetical protein OXE49_00075, partial [Gemmatimonadetes bacterium]|nr:hypothetical protein [Gemmatimonadota bacterium]